MDGARQHYGEALKIHRQLAEQDPAVYLQDMAMTLNNLARVDRLQNRIEESRAYYTEALTAYRKLAQGDRARYAGDVARVEASLEDLGRKAPSQ
jgi:tetratricopeptide (TPR) repeat protein